MLRSLFRSPRSVRLPLQNGTVDVQRVAITRNSKSSPVFRRLFTTVAVTYFVAKTINHYFPDSAHGSKPAAETVVTARKAEERAKGWQGQWDKANRVGSQDEPEVVHLMLPIWIRKRKPEPWQADDPIWKSFQALADDKKRLKEITDTVKKQLLRAVLIKYGSVLMNLTSKESDGNHRLAFHDRWRLAPPLHAPATYEVPCIFLEPNRTSFGWRQVPNNVGAKMDRLFHPISLAKAVLYGLQEFAWASYVITKSRLTDKINTLSSRAKDSTSPPKLSIQDEKVLKQLRLGKYLEQAKDSAFPFLRGEYGEHESRRAYRDLVKSMTYQGAIESASAMFQAHWIREQDRSLQVHSRDSTGVILRGNLAFVGERGTLFLHASAVFSPEANSLIGQPVIEVAYLTPNMEKWVQPPMSNQQSTEDGLAEVEKEKTRLVGRGARETVPGSALKPSSPEEDAPRTDKSQAEAEQDENREK